MIRLNIDGVLQGFGNLNRRLEAIGSIRDDAGDLMESWERIIEEDNRQGILAGTDRDGNHKPVKYRPVGQAMKPSVRQRLGKRANVRRGAYMGFGPAASGLHNNLTPEEYRKLGGPRLAPRGQFSRVITNFLTGHGRDPSNSSLWFAEGRWFDIVDTSGNPFLKYHLDPSSNLYYPINGIRAAGLQKLRDSLRAWAKLTIRQKYAG
jgi:hypothetical protein